MNSAKGLFFPFSFFFRRARQGGRRFWKVELIVLIIQGFLWSSLQFMTWLLSGRRKWNRMGRMMNSVFKCLMSVACAVALPALGQEKAGFPTDRAVTVFSAGEGNPYASIRIPALLQIGKGQLLAFAEGRYKNTDQGENDIIMSVSKNGAGRGARPVPLPRRTEPPSTIHALFMMPKRRR